MIIFLYGEDTFRSRQKLKQLKEKFFRDVDLTRSSFTVLDGETATMEKINERLSPISLFSKKRMVVIDNIFSAKDQALAEKLLEFLKQREGGMENIVIFWDSITEEEKLPKAKKELFNFLRQQKYAQHFKPLSNTEATAWTKEQVEARGGKISHQATQELTSLVGSDLWQINNEIDKLLAYREGREEKIVAGGEPITIEFEDVKKLVRGSFDENIFALTDAISNNNKALAAKLFEEQVEAGLTDGYLLTMIIRQFRILLQIKEALDQGNTSRKITNLLKLHPFVVQKGITQARNFTIPVLRRIMSQLIEVDLAMKTGKGEVKTMLNVLMARL